MSWIEPIHKGGDFNIYGTIMVLALSIMEQKVVSWLHDMNVIITNKLLVK